MKVLLREPGALTASLVPGPGDLAGKTGTLVLVDVPTTTTGRTDDRVVWGQAVAAFVFRGGQVATR